MHWNIIQRENLMSYLNISSEPYLNLDKLFKNCTLLWNKRFLFAKVILFKNLNFYANYRAENVTFLINEHFHSTHRKKS